METTMEAVVDAGVAPTAEKFMERARRREPRTSPMNSLRVLPLH